MNIREATPKDNHELQGLQAKCPQGSKFVVSLINTPDFFARAKAYGSSKVYVASGEERIIGSNVSMSDAPIFIDGIDLE